MADPNDTRLAAPHHTALQMASDRFCKIFDLTNGKSTGSYKRPETAGDMSLSSA